MKFSTFALLGVVSSSSSMMMMASAAKGIDDHTNLRTTATSSDESNCHSIHDKNLCKAESDNESNESCIWCECSAVPPVCVSEDESKSLPAGVFTCESPDSSSSSDAAQDNDELIYDFGLNDGRIIQLRENIMEKGSEEGEFCDSSSKSISGYMDVKGSKVRTI
jgi:hypothetical protein